MPAFEFLSYDELMIVAVGGLFLVVRNWWDWFRDAFEHPKPASTPLGLAVHPAARAAAALRRLRRAGRSVRHRRGA